MLNLEKLVNAEQPQPWVVLIEWDGKTPSTFYRQMKKLGIVYNDGTAIAVYKSTASMIAFLASEHGAKRIAVGRVSATVHWRTLDGGARFGADMFNPTPNDPANFPARIEEQTT